MCCVGDQFCLIVSSFSSYLLSIMSLSATAHLFLCKLSNHQNGLPAANSASTEEFEVWGKEFIVRWVCVQFLNLWIIAKVIDRRSFVVAKLLKFRVPKLPLCWLKHSERSLASMMLVGLSGERS